MKEYTKAKEICVRILQNDPDNVKALLRGIFKNDFRRITDKNEFKNRKNKLRKEYLNKII
jgi:hypothetical protein